MFQKHYFFTQPSLHCCSTSIHPGFNAVLVPVTLRPLLISPGCSDWSALSGLSRHFRLFVCIEPPEQATRLWILLFEFFGFYILGNLFSRHSYIYTICVPLSWIFWFLTTWLPETMIQCELTSCAYSAIMLTSSALQQTFIFPTGHWSFHLHPEAF